MSEEDLAGPVQSLKENYRGHVFDVYEQNNAIHVHVPKGSPLKLPKTYRGRELVRVEEERKLEAPGATPATPSAELDEIRALIADLVQRVEVLESQK